MEKNSLIAVDRRNGFTYIGREIGSDGSTIVLTDCVRVSTQVFAEGDRTKRYGERVRSAYINGAKKGKERIRFDRLEILAKHGVNQFS